MDNVKILFKVVAIVVGVILLGFGAFSLYMDINSLGNHTYPIRENQYTSADRIAFDKIIEKNNINDNIVIAHRCIKDDQAMYHLEFARMTDLDDSHYYAPDGTLLADCDFFAATGPYLRKTNKLKFDMCKAYTRTPCTYNDLIPYYVTELQKEGVPTLIELLPIQQ